MRNSFARSFLQVLALLTGLAVATVWRDRHNHLVDYPEIRSTKAELGLGVNGAQSFLRTGVSLAGGAVNLAAWLGHQELGVDRTWASAPNVSARVRGDEASEIAVELRGQGGEVIALRLSNRPERPSAWLRIDDAGTHLSKTLLPYSLPKGKWLRLDLHGKNGSLEPVVSGERLSAFPAPAGPVRVLFRGDSRSGRMQLDDISIQGGGQSYEESFSGTMPWVLFLVTTAAASILFFLLERRLSPRASAAIAASGFLLLCAGLAAYRAGVAERYPLSVNLRGVASHIESREEALARLRALAPSPKPVLLWLGSSQAWGAGASKPGRTAFSLVRERLEKGSGLEWVNGAISAARLADQREAFEAVSAKRKVAWVVLTIGLNDSENTRFPAELAAFAGALKAAGTKLFLVPEAVEPEPNPLLLARHSEAAAFARLEGLPYVEPQEFFRAHADDGFLWWDFVHFTDAGQRLEAGVVEKPLAAALAGQR